MERLLGMLRAAGDATRLRLLLLLVKAELTVSELTEILGQSQPRVSRHLKLLCEAGLLERFKEGAWVFYRASDQGEAAELARALPRLVDSENDPVLIDDRRRLAQVRAQRAQEAAAYFRANAPRWERIRSLHVPEAEVERLIVRLLEQERLDYVLDAGTGTGRMLELLAPHIKRGIGIDVSPEMLAIARDRLGNAGAFNCQVRRGDVYRLPFADGEARGGFDAVLFHQVLHYLDDPQAALREAIRVLKPGGRIMIVDFAPHNLEFLRNEHAHRRLGFSEHEVLGWFKLAGLKPVATESLAPRSGAETLTVMVWVAETPGVTARRKKIEAAA
jgi:ArsR family transcriptional regulator